jgi:hypothetical protein
MSHDPIPTRSHVSIIKTYNETNFILIGDKFLQNCIRKLYVHINNSYKINVQNVYRFRAFWLDKSIVTCLFLIRS